MAEVWVGTSGWAYKEWVGSLYPAKTPASRFLEAYASSGLSTVEAHNTFRRRPRQPALEGWAAQVPGTFTFAPKAHVAITHQRDLTGVEDRVAEFFDLLSPLGSRLGPVLFQLPHHEPDLDRLDRLLAAIPEGSATAFELAPAWHDDADVRARLDRRGATLVLVDDEDATPQVVDLGTCAYVRLRRPRYSDGEIGRWAERLRSVAGSGRPVYVYLRHEGDPTEAVRLQEAVRG